MNESGKAVQALLSILYGLDIEDLLVIEAARENVHSLRR